MSSFTDRYPAEYRWLVENAERNDFAASLLRGLRQYGGLTERQLAAVQRALRPAPKAVEVKVEAVVAAFETAKASGLRRPKLRFATFECSRAPDHGKNPGAIYVTTYEDKYLGKVQGGVFHASFACTPVEREQVATVMSDPIAAAIAYGKRTGACSVCARELSDPASVERGIGPICAERFGWAA